ncbi:hypothetical protein BJY16_006479 [Actinoplanes octamycinicus]|uniref:YrhK-like protein n=1 Tax=Actinoplanes octamycinicus TaxID=135948 RepID=A0A7W7H304_9ACTN|nr:hypothetical protein [Actinoplanes octamycinicus]MBB4743020.1 hypothetical protein [Actinoplanes octamycinicus]GIE58125.1 hypothetical protein Aoc01nite_35270 [Actinoplanes octamycinicus]
MASTRYPTTPAEWSTARRRTVGPFTTHITYRRDDGRTVEWSSRGHRKHASRLSRASWWIAVLFAAGSLCFLIAPIPAFLDLVGPAADGLVFFVGSILFTAAAGLQWLETINAERGPGRRRWRLLTFEPRRIDWWSCGVQLVGTLYFNVTTFQALRVGLDSADYDRLVWRPDAIGSLCFLISGYLAYVEVTGHLLGRPRRTLESAIASVNLLGCLAFGASAVASYVVPSADAELGPALVNTGTALGALCFLIGALLLFPEGTHEARSAARR